MLYVARDKNGRIAELHPAPIGNAQESVATDDPEALQFIHERWRQNELAELDRDFIRVIEDMVELMVSKGMILFTDLPPKVQEKLLRRKEVREKTHYADQIGAGGDDIIPI